MRTVLALIAIVSVASAASCKATPAGLSGQLPAGYDVIASTQLVAGQPGRIFQIIALGRHNEGDGRSRAAPPRPLLIFERRGARFALAGRNDHVVMKADEGGQCDPFLDGNATIATKGRYFTVQNGVACGQHWTDYVTFRLDGRTGGFVFDNERLEWWSLTSNSSPDAEALVRDGPPQVVRDHPGHLTPFAVWRPRK